ncbi:MAG: polysaccharide pyruvyl transferase family protein [Bacillaceae bacterium]|nr:polysaccharide pyruvyl transferase family protein [Bacillaceae bacterium]
MKIGIVGNYGNNNHGDEAILLGVIHQLETYFQVKRQNIVVFSNQPEQTAERYQVTSEPLYIKKGNGPLTFAATFKRHLNTVRKLDLLMIGGGGILMDLYGTEAFLYGLYGWVARAVGCPYVIYGVGAGPILTKRGGWMIRQLAQSARVVSVRDEKSKEMLKDIGVKQDIHVIGDPAFQIPYFKERKRRKVPVKIGVTAVPYYHRSYWPEENLEKYERYMEGMANNLDGILEQYPDTEVTFFATKHPQDMWVTKEIRKRMNYGGRTVIMEEALMPLDIVEVAGNMDLVIGTRLHSLILSLVAETPVMAVSYHHKVKDFMEMLGQSSRVISIEDIDQHPLFFAERYGEMREDWEAVQKAYRELSEMMKQKAIQGMPLIEKTLGRSQ